MKQGMGGQVEAVYDNLHRMKFAFIYSGVALRIEIALRAVNPLHPSSRGFVWSLYGPTIVLLWSYGGWPVCLLEDSLVGACLPRVRCRACLTPGARLEQAGSLSRHESSVLTNINHCAGTGSGIRAGAKRNGEGSAMARSGEDRRIHPEGARSRSGAAEVDGGDVGLPAIRDRCSYLGPLAGAAAL